jgi:predicted dehydrogenase
MSRPLRVAVIGLGFGQQVHVPAFRADPRCEVTTVCASTEAKAAEVAYRLQVPHASGNWRALVASPEIDAVSIAVPPRLQPDIAAAALRQGKAVFCEKPLAADIDDARAAREAAEHAGRPNMLNFEFGECDAWRCVQELIDSNRIGRITSVDVDWRVQTYANRNRLENWKSRPAEGGGALQAFVAHTFYYLERFAGPITWLQARLAKAADDPRTGETEAVLEVKFVSGGRATVYVATDAPPPHRHRIDIVGEHGVLRLVNEESDYIAGFRALHAPWAGAKMTAVFPQSATRGEGHADGGADFGELSRAAVGDGRVVATSRLVRKFVDWIVEGTSARPNFADGHRVQFLIEAARRSNAEGHWLDAPV